jgi:hypothetical protein
VKRLVRRRQRETEKWSNETGFGEKELWENGKMK